jgi:hypothetical protein
VKGGGSDLGSVQGVAVQEWEEGVAVQGWEEVWVMEA